MNSMGITASRKPQTSFYPGTSHVYHTPPGVPYPFLYPALFSLKPSIPTLTTNNGENFFFTQLAKTLQILFLY